MAYTLYKHTVPNGKVYIGITSSKPKERWKSGSGYAKNKHFSSAIKKYGWKNIKHEILLTGLTQEEAFEKEIELIKEYRSNEREFGYNEKGGNYGGRNKKKVLCVETGDIFLGAAAAAEWAGLKNRYSIYFCCERVGYHKTAAGYHWKYYHEEDQDEHRSTTDT